MGKWWLLLTALVLWLACGYALLGPRPVDASPDGKKGHSTPSPQDRLVHQGREKETKYPPSPSRIVSMAPNLTEILFALGLGEKVVGVTQDSDYPPAAAAKPRVGTFWQPSIEAVIAARPDLVVTLAFEQQRELARRLTRIGCRCLVAEVDTVGGLFDAIAALGEAAGAPEQARKLSDDMRAALHRVRAATAGRRRVKVLWVVQREPLRVAGRDTFVNEMIELAGGANAIGPTLHKYPPIGAEQVIAARPEVIIEPAMIPNALDEQRRQAVSYWRRYANLPAVADGRIYVVDGDMVSRLSPRLPMGIDMIAKYLRPPGE